MSSLLDKTPFTWTDTAFAKGKFCHKDATSYRGKCVDEKCANNCRIFESAEKGFCRMGEVKLICICTYDCAKWNPLFRHLPKKRNRRVLPKAKIQRLLPPNNKASHDKQKFRMFEHFVRPIHNHGINHKLSLSHLNVMNIKLRSLCLVIIIKAKNNVKPTNI